MLWHGPGLNLKILLLVRIAKIHAEIKIRPRLVKFMFLVRELLYNYNWCGRAGFHYS